MKPPINFAAIPTEIIEQFFCYIKLFHINEYRLLCRRVNRIISSSSFARIHLATYLHSGQRFDRLEQLLSLPWLPMHKQIFASCYMDIAVIERAKTSKVSWKIIPPILGKLQSLTILDLQRPRRHQLSFAKLENRIALTGPIPTELGTLRNLEVLNLDRNALTGSIPSSLCTVKSLVEFSASENKLTGTIPHEIELLVNLTVLNLDGNGLTGSIPAGLGKLTNLTILNTSCNKLNGKIPDEIGQLLQLQELRLCQNMVVGAVPEKIFQLPRLEVLDLSVNFLTGSISIKPVPPRTVSTLLLSSLFAICWATTIEVGYGFSYTLDSQLTQSLDKIFGIYLLMNWHGGSSQYCDSVSESTTSPDIAINVCNPGAISLSCNSIHIDYVRNREGRDYCSMYTAQFTIGLCGSSTVHVDSPSSGPTLLCLSLRYIVSWWFLLTVGFPKPSEEEKLLDETDSFLPAYAEPVPIYDPSPSLPSSSF
ncbi:hypothetical protein BDR26DRAFT_1005699 [Obelidium mucronatum]|nr:hypothetical protein BDR26DRAFT_1005699 [Obelidium mucronatum]